MSLMTVYHGLGSYGSGSGLLFEMGVTFWAIHLNFAASPVEAHQAFTAGTAEIFVFLPHLLAGEKSLDLEADIGGPLEIFAVFLLALGQVFGENPEQGIDFSRITDQDGQEESKKTADKGDQDAGHEGKDTQFIHTVPAGHEPGQPDAEPIEQRTEKSENFVQFRHLQRCCMIVLEKGHGYDSIPFMKSG